MSIDKPIKNEKEKRKPNGKSSDRPKSKDKCKDCGDNRLPEVKVPNAKSIHEGFEELFKLIGQWDI